MPKAIAVNLCRLREIRFLSHLESYQIDDVAYQVDRPSGPADLCNATSAPINSSNHSTCGPNDRWHSHCQMACAPTGICRAGAKQLLGEDWLENEENETLGSIDLVGLHIACVALCCGILVMDKANAKGDRRVRGERQHRKVASDLRARSRREPKASALKVILQLNSQPSYELRALLRSNGVKVRNSSLTSTRSRSSYLQA